MASSLVAGITPRIYTTGGFFFSLRRNVLGSLQTSAPWKAVVWRIWEFAFPPKKGVKPRQSPCSCKTTVVTVGMLFSFSFVSWSQSWNLICTVGRKKRKEGGREGVGQLSLSVPICTLRHLPRNLCPNPSIHPYSPIIPVDKKSRDCVQQGALLPTVRTLWGRKKGRLAIREGTLQLLA